MSVETRQRFVNVKLGVTVLPSGGVLELPEELGAELSEPRVTKALNGKEPRNRAQLTWKTRICFRTVRSSSTNIGGSWHEAKVKATMELFLEPSFLSAFHTLDTPSRFLASDGVALRNTTKSI